MAANRAWASTGFADVTAQQQQIADHMNVLDAEAMLR
jgi:hypothetical protein